MLSQILKSRDSAISIVTGLGAGRPWFNTGLG